MHDVIVVGAGPAGNIAALQLAGQGHSVAVVDWRTEIGDKLCTGIVGAECARRFPPDKSDIHHRARSATVIAPSGAEYRVARDETQAYVIDRVAYVQRLAERAMDAGAEYRLGHRVVGIEIDDRGAAVRTTFEDAPTRISARLIILGSGFGSSLLAMAGLRSRSNREYMAGTQAVVDLPHPTDTVVYLGEKVAPGSFAWLVPTSPTQGLAGMAGRGPQNGHFDNFLATLRDDGRICGPASEPRRWGIPLKPVQKSYGRRVMVVGDAAGLVKPTSGGGIYYALLSGEIAANVAHDALIAGDFSAKRLRQYEQGWKALFGSELRIGYYARMLYETLGDRQIERLLKTFLSPDVQDELINARDFSFDWHSRIILRAIRHGELRSLVTSFGPAVAPFLSRLARMRPRGENDIELLDAPPGPANLA